MDINKTVRIVMPVVKEEWCLKDYLIKALYSVSRQTYPHNQIQLVIAWDGWKASSTQAILDICKPGLDKVSVTSLHSELPQGVCIARNKCILLDTVPTPGYLVYLDADNEMAPEFIKTMACKILKLGNTTLVYCLQKMMVHDDLRLVTTTWTRGKPTHNATREAFMKLIYKGNWIDMGTIIYPYRTDILFDTNLTRMVDWDLILALGLEYKFYYIKDILSIYNRNISPNGISNSAPFQSNLDVIKDKWRDAYNA